MLTFSTLGPEGGNHHFVLKRYLEAHRLEDAVRIVVFDDFHVGAQALIKGAADYMLQCAVHPAAAEITGRYRAQLRPVDAFISPSRPMALVRARRAGSHHGAVGVQPATSSYADLSAWQQVVHEPTVLAVQAGLIEGRYDAGIVFSSFALAQAELYQVLEPIGTVCDAWTVFGREPVDAGAAVVWRDSPVARQYWLAIGKNAGQPRG
ncbi:MAG: hypothetical protein EOO27_33670 [Comamonadaceae bacterium]|nr:MAG: hypothetical protein EOO27_33670 [Comamonadaceae bacterium]